MPQLHSSGLDEHRFHRTGGKWGRVRTAAETTMRAAGGGLCNRGGAGRDGVQNGGS